MRPVFVPEFVSESVTPFAVIDASTPWVRLAGTPRDECFMALDTSLTYSYGNDNQRRTRVYTASRMIGAVEHIMARLNAAKIAGGDAYNVCVLNRYPDEHSHLGWHADDSPEQDASHPIAVIAFGATREIWVKPRGAKGAVPLADRFALSPGALFVMPTGFQATMLHRIPKHDRPCGPRISLTFRKLDHPARVTP